MSEVRDELILQAAAGSIPWSALDGLAELLDEWAVDEVIECLEISGELGTALIRACEGDGPYRRRVPLSQVVMRLGIEDRRAVVRAVLA